MNHSQNGAQPKAKSKIDLASSSKAPGKLKSSSQRETSDTNLSFREGSKSQLQLAKFLRKKLRWQKIHWELIVLIAPLAMLIFLLVSDGTTVHVLKAQFAGSLEQATSEYAEALKIRKDPELLVEKAWMEKANGDSEAENEDLIAASRAGARSSDISYDMAVVRANREGIDSKTLGLLRETASLAINHLRRFQLDVTDDAMNLNRSIYSLVACGEYKTASAILKTAAHSRYGDGDKLFFGGVLARETGSIEDAEANLDLSTGETNLDYSYDPQCFEALLSLDKGDPTAAAEHLSSIYSSSSRTVYPSWLMGYTEAWIALEKKDFKKADTETTKIIRTFTENERPGIVGLNSLAASYLLKAHILEQRGDKAQAVINFANFTELKRKGVTGKLLIPKPYRTWINADLKNAAPRGKAP